MRRHGWAGNIPVDDDEAVSRIVAAARASIDARGTVSVSEVAAELGITRQTVYRYFPTLDALLTGTALSAVGGFLDRLAQDLASITEQTFLRGRAAYGGQAQSTQVVKLLEDLLGTDLRAEGFPARLE